MQRDLQVLQDQLAAPDHKDHLDLLALLDYEEMMDQQVQLVQAV